MVSSPQTAKGANASGAPDNPVARHVPHIYVPRPWEAEQIDVDDVARRHLEKVLRVGGPFAVTYTDGAGLVGEGVFERGRIERGPEQTVSPRSSSLTLAVAIPKSTSRVRFVVEKLSELGVDRLVWLQTEHTEGRPPRMAKAGEWARAALEQSGGAFMMQIEGPVPISRVYRYGSVLFADRTGSPVGELGSVDSPVLCIGPEGGFSDDEFPTDAIRVRLAQSVLRVETAAIAGAVLLLG
jgi:16S rRNA (uracil1498-N3)-methyltransferase